MMRVLTLEKLANAIHKDFYPYSTRREFKILTSILPSLCSKLYTSFHKIIIIMNSIHHQFCRTSWAHILSSETMVTTFSLKGIGSSKFNALNSLSVPC